ncbi:2-C-methyl-D-erythritol 4-phosphate cytidylyltransferase [bacterium]|nr:2-C-methyl-D-erythritol 4-phosphate cytidylyltransferase [bacterium]
MRYSAIITAGGTSSRFGNTNKLLEKINGQEIIKYTVDAFVSVGFEEIVICANLAILNILQDIFANYGAVKIIEGGSTRQESVFKGLEVVDCDYVLIHDGARPMITSEIIKRTMDEVASKKAVSVMTKTVDTIKKVDTNGRIIETVDRTQLYNTQTPQAFEYNLIKSVHEQYKGQNFTDDAGMVEASGAEVYIVEGDYRNIKVTTKSDLALAQVYLAEKM